MYLGTALGERHGGGSALVRRGGFPLTDPYQTSNAAGERPGVRPWELSSMVERETAQTAGEGPEVPAKWAR